MKTKTALIVGATGLVGSELLKSLSEGNYYKKIKTLARKPIKLLSKSHEHYIVDFDAMEEFDFLFEADDLFICIGTTLKKAGSKDRFVEIDKGYAVGAAKCCIAQGGERVFLVSAMGANSSSKIFYNRVKGQIEEEISQLGYQQHYFFRPSLLLGARNEQRVFERLAQIISNGVNFVLESTVNLYIGTKVVDLVLAIKICAQEETSSNPIISNKQIKKISRDEKDK